MHVVLPLSHVAGKTSYSKLVTLIACSCAPSLSSHNSAAELRETYVVIGLSVTDLYKLDLSGPKKQQQLESRKYTVTEIADRKKQEKKGHQETISFSLHTISCTYLLISFIHT